MTHTETYSIARKALDALHDENTKNQLIIDGARAQRDLAIECLKDTLDLLPNGHFVKNRIKGVLMGFNQRLA